MKKLTRKEISEGLEQVPINQILLGSNQAGITLTKKQKAFAEEVVRSGNKSAAYRKSYNHKGKPETASRDAQKVANNPKVSTYIQALEQAKEAEAYLLPARLRSIAIHRLTGLALNEEIPPAQQLKALELIGKMTEVALFTERRELIQTTDSGTMREQLLNSIRLAISSEGAEDVEAVEIDSLMAEISGSNSDTDQPIDSERDNSEMDAQDSDPAQPEDQETPDPSSNDIPATPPTPDPLFLGSQQDSPCHSIPLNQSSPKTKNKKNQLKINDLQGGRSVTPVTPSTNPNKDTPPSSIPNAQGEGV
jgi:hypothetical protein